MFARLEDGAPNAVMQVAGQHNIHNFDRFVGKQFAIITHDANTGMRLSRRRLRALGVSRNGNKLRSRRFDNRSRVMTAPRAEPDQRESNWRISAHQKRGAVVSGVAGMA